MRIVRVPLTGAAEPPPHLAGHLVPVIVVIVETSNLDASARSRPGGVGRVAAKHGHARSKFRAT